VIDSHADGRSPRLPTLYDFFISIYISTSIFDFAYFGFDDFAVFDYFFTRSYVATGQFTGATCILPHCVSQQLVFRTACIPLSSRATYWLLTQSSRTTAYLKKSLAIIGLVPNWPILFINISIMISSVHSSF
jgi:hypothetical protein